MWSYWKSLSGKIFNKWNEKGIFIERKAFLNIMLVNENAFLKIVIFYKKSFVSIFYHVRIKVF